MSNINVQVAEVNDAFFNPRLADNPCVSRYNLRKADFANTMTDIYEFMGDLNVMSVERGWGRFEDMLQLQALSNVLSNLLNSTMAKHSRELVVNTLPNGHPDLIRTGIYPNNLVAEAEDGVEMKATRNTGAAVDMHSAREQDLCTFVYQVDERRDDPGVPIAERQPLTFTGIFLGHVTEEDYRHNERGERGTRTATLSKDGLSSYRRSWVISPTSYAERYGQDAVSIFQCCEFRNRIAGKIVVFGVSFNAKA